MGWLWALSLPGVVCLLVLLAALERFGLWLHGRSWLPWRRRRTGMPVSAAGFDELGAVFAAGKRDELEYRQSVLMRRDDEDDGAPPATLPPDGFTGRIALPPRPPGRPAAPGT